jgi:hypothetical protein
MARRIAAAIVAVGLFANVAVAEDDYLVDFGFGALATVTNLVYMPAKIIYGTVGGLVGVTALGVTGGDIDTAKGVWSPTLGGHYVVTANMLRGEEPVLFVGPTYYKSCESVAGRWTDSDTVR